MPLLCTSDISKCTYLYKQTFLWFALYGNAQEKKQENGEVNAKVSYLFLYSIAIRTILVFIP